VNTLIAVVLTRVLAAPVQSWLAAFDGQPVELLTGGSMAWPRARRRANEREKFMRARDMALGGGYDALLLVQDDVIVPPDALPRLQAVLAGGADVAYSLAVRRDAGHHWSALLEMRGEHHLLALSEDETRARAVWGGVLDVPGIALYCTLINRRALRAMTCEIRGIHAADWYMAEDWQAAGLVQRCDTGCRVGHQLDADTVLWPSLDAPVHWLYRAEPAGEGVPA